MSDLADFLNADITLDPLDKACTDAILALADAAAVIAGLIRDPKASIGFGVVRDSANADGDTQKALDVVCDDLVSAALAKAGVAVYLSEEQDEPVSLAADGKVIVACDPLDGSSNIDTNISIGTIFSILPAAGGTLQAGRNQLASGFFVYGPQTTMLLTTGDGVHAFQMDDSGRFQRLDWDVRIAPETGEFAINASNSRHWFKAVSAYITDCLSGKDGPRGRNFNMRWVGSLVADSWRIFRRGGVFLYPGDARDGYGDGRLRLIYEAAPVALLVEKAGGRAITGDMDILDVQPESLHQRVPLIFGSSNEVDVIATYHS
jgi:fructose-1,6-bisphosphatase I